MRGIYFQLVLRFKYLTNFNRSLDRITTAILVRYVFFLRGLELCNSLQFRVSCSTTDYPFSDYVKTIFLPASGRILFNLVTSLSVKWEGGVKQTIKRKSRNSMKGKRIKGKKEASRLRKNSC